MQSNIILIGLPGSGKSTLGVQLAKYMGFEFIDADILIQSKQQKTLQNIVDEQGYLKFREIEAEVILDIDAKKTVIATGGSAVYSAQAMAHLRSIGTVVYLEVDLDIIQQRLNNNEASRGIARAPEQSLQDVLLARLPLYEKYAHITWNNNHFKGLHRLAKEIVNH